MSSGDWRLDDSLTEAEIRQEMVREGWEPIEAVDVYCTFTSVPQHACTTVTTVIPGGRMTLTRKIFM